MHLVLLTFTLAFAILRVMLRVSADSAGDASVQLRGTLEEWKIIDCSSELEEKYNKMIKDCNQFDEVWDILEDYYKNHKDEIRRTGSANRYSKYNTPERNMKIWDQLMKYGRRPLYRYNHSFRYKRGFNTNCYYSKCGDSLTMVDSVNYCRALWCLMSMHGKFPEFAVEIDWRATTGHVPPRADPMVTYDEYECGDHGPVKVEKKW